jgi:hypothetical protein
MPPPEIIPEAIAKRRLATYTLLRLAGLFALFSGVWLAQHGIGVLPVLLVLVGGASLFVRPKLLARLLGSRW